MPPPPNPSALEPTSIGHLVFPNYSSASSPEDTAWMKKVYLYVGKHQRLTGEVKKLAKPLGVVRRKNRAEAGGQMEHSDELEIVEVVSWKIVFSSRPEPVGGIGD